jgi:hypothetical protein
MLRWLPLLFGTLLFTLTLSGCAAGDTGGAAKSPASFHGRGIVANPQTVAAKAESYSFDDDALETASTSSPGAKEEPPAKAAQVALQPPPPPPGVSTPKPSPGPSFVAQSSHVADLIIYTATVTMAVYQVEPGLDAVERIAREVNGYLAQRTDSQITIRVPRAKFDETLRRVQLTGDVIHRDVSAEDVTDQYVELETRLKNARAMRDRLEQLLARAAVKEAIDIEKELGRVTGDIEAMEGKLKVLKDKIAYSTLTVVFSPRGSNAVRDVPLRLPFGWLGDLGLPRLLSLGEGQ